MLVVDLTTGGMERLEAQLLDFSPVMSALDTHLRQVTAEAFRTQADPTGRPWAPLRPRTRAERKAQGYPAERPILRRSGALAASIVSALGSHTVQLRSTLPHSGVLQRGRYSGSHMPPRPFLGLSPDTPEFAREAIAQHLLG
jgi:phage gpG-like protein